ncbi:MAG: transposase, partial [Bacteroidales bacterium]|nr:transposase [Bacteroidales bacterium]
MQSGSKRIFSLEIWVSVFEKTNFGQSGANLTQKPSGKKGGNFPLMHRFIMTFKAWLRGTHHHVNNLQAYINEYTFRYNRHIMKRGIFENLLAKVIAHPPKTYKLLYA